MIYFIEAETSGHIGITDAMDATVDVNHLADRYGEAIRIIGEWDASGEEADRALEPFRPLQIKDGWFRPEPSLIAFIADVCKPGAAGATPERGA